MTKKTLKSTKSMTKMTLKSTKNMTKNIEIYKKHNGI